VNFKGKELCVFVYPFMSSSGLKLCLFYSFMVGDNGYEEQNCACPFRGMGITAQSVGEAVSNRQKLSE
jgi:hypothetical protein